MTSSPLNLTPRALMATAVYAAALLPFAMLLLPGPTTEPLLTSLAAVATLAVLVAVRAAPSDLAGTWLVLLPALVYLAVIAMLREAGGGNSSGLGPMVMLPAIAVALVGARGPLIVTVAAIGLVYWVPVALGDGAGRYPVSGYRIGVLFVCLSGLLGLAIVSLRQQLQHQAGRFERMAFIDGLTALPNRRAWDAALRSGLANARRRGEVFCIAHIDIDHFKSTNDEHGHAAGDALLRRIGTAWSALVRPGDVLARVGGDEFALLLPACDLDMAEAILNRISRSGAPPTCSVGIAEWDGMETAEAVTRRADRHLYEAKRLGRNRVVTSANAGVAGTDAPHV